MTSIPSKYLRKSFALLVYVTAVLLSFPQHGWTQDKIIVQVKAFDQHLKPLKDTEIAFNNLEWFVTNNKGMAIVTLNASDIPIGNVRLKDETIEAASWNLSKGIVEIIVRPRSYKLSQFVVRFPDGTLLRNTPVTFKGRAVLTATTNNDGKFELPVGFDERVTSADQFLIPDLNVINISLSENENVLIVERPRVREAPKTETPATEVNEKPEPFNLEALDTVKSLVDFYAMFSRIPIGSLGDEARAVIDARFRSLLAAKEDSIVNAQSMYVKRISDSSLVAEDIRNLLLQATVEGTTLTSNRTEFEKRISQISEKLQHGVTNLSSDTRTSLLRDIDQLEKLLTENESKFYQHHNDYREIIATLKEKYFDIQNLETRLSEAERKSEEDRQQFRRQMVGIGGVVVVFGLLIILLIYFSTRLRKQTKSLQQANEDIERINENLEGMVQRRTHLLETANKELDTFLYRASHDLRAPVRSIIGLCQIMEHIPQEELVNRVENATLVMDRVLNKLIDISEIAQESLNTGEVAVLELINHVRNRQLVMSHNARVFRNNQPILINKKPVQFDVNCPPAIKVQTSKSLLEIIINNLIENALFFSGLKNDGGNAKVGVAVVIVKEKLVITVSDNGIGIAESVKPRLFSMFFTGHEASKGNGLGLYAVRKCVDALHGTVKIESEEGKFTVVTVTIPPMMKEVPKKVISLPDPVNPVATVQ